VAFVLPGHNWNYWFIVFELYKSHHFKQKAWLKSELESLSDQNSGEQE
jgi:hypothetical protein